MICKSDKWGPVLSKAEYALEFFWAEMSSFFKLHEIHSADRGDLD